VRTRFSKHSKTDTFSECALAEGISTVFWEIGLRTVQWTEIGQVFNIDYQYTCMLCYWLNKLLHYGWTVDWIQGLVWSLFIVGVTASFCLVTYCMMGLTSFTFTSVYWLEQVVDLQLPGFGSCPALLNSDRVEIYRWNIRRELRNILLQTCSGRRLPNGSCHLRCHRQCGFV